MPADSRDAGLQRIKAAFKDSTVADVKSRWDLVVRVTTDEVGPEQAERFLADFQPYFE